MVLFLENIFKYLKAFLDGGETVEDELHSGLPITWQTGKCFQDTHTKNNSKSVVFGNLLL